MFAYLDSRGCRAEILVVSDGSADGTEQQVRQLAEGRHDVSVIENGVNRGKGFSVRRGVLEASGSLILFCDADGSTPIEELDKLLAAIDAGCDVAIGSRALPQSDIRQAQPLWRETMGRIFNGFVQVTALPGIRDTQCGFKCFTRQAARLIFPRQRIDRFGFDVEVLWLARKLGLRSPRSLSPGSTTPAVLSTLFATRAGCSSTLSACAARHARRLWPSRCGGRGRPGTRWPRPDRRRRGGHSSGAYELLLPGTA